MSVEVGDKVRVRTGEHAGARGVVAVVEGNSVTIRLDGTAVTVALPTESVTNFSEAARKAWQSQPRRQVGRRKGTRLSDRVSVTLRIDREVWERFRFVEAHGIIEDRTATINRWFREKLDELKQEEASG
jgi:uncharacterized protein (DUF4415 family)